ncbi:uncharacterized protein EDB91DRAFT_1077475 [Suillus paluster]|uniref:uncharacterized protein n=1 Tax=Suillus paluster TaxID=48578 RepID=UPI001B8755FD|nr:uncharacterized protein EDB91DRAFT_1077475 [Suillus paluster]KAG1753770.1 hypothetical protein EDB91DRAFT_1077475 [Suillus paluster]
MSSHSWEGLAQLLVAEGFFVVAPNLLGHASRRGTDYRVSAFAEDLRPYFVMDTSYDVIIAHSFGGPVALSLLPFLPKTKETTIILVDPVLEVAEEKLKVNRNWFLTEMANVRTTEEHMTENPAWSRRDSVLRALGVSMCDPTVVEVFRQNSPWSFSGLFKNIPPNINITVLVSDPKFSDRCYLEHVPRDVERLNARVLTGIGHWIQYERPDAIMDVIPLSRAKFLSATVTSNHMLLLLLIFNPQTMLLELSRAPHSDADGSVSTVIRGVLQRVIDTPHVLTLPTLFHTIPFVVSTSQWGSPTASRRALLIHGMTMSSSSWEGIAQLLAAEGYFVVAPNLLGHAFRRRSTDYRVSAFAEDLRPYLAMDMSYDETTIVLVDPALELTEETVKVNTNWFLEEMANVRTAEEHMAENPSWSRRDSVLRVLGIAMCDSTVVEVFQQNSPWSFSGLFKNIPPNVKIMVLVSDPQLTNICHLEHIPHDMERLNARVLTGTGHWIQYERPDAIMDAILLPSATLLLKKEMSIRFIQLLPTTDTAERPATCPSPTLPVGYTSTRATIQPKGAAETTETARYTYQYRRLQTTQLDRR